MKLPLSNGRGGGESALAREEGEGGQAPTVLFELKMA